MPLHTILRSLILSAEILERFLERPTLPSFHRSEPTSYPLDRFGTLDRFEELLVAGRVMDHRGRLTVHRENHGPTRTLDLT